MGRSQEQWHEELDKVTTSLDRLALDADEEVRSVVLDRLKRPTDIFLRKKRWFFSSTTQEDRLNGLIRGHSDKSVALLSCAHALSRPTIRSLLATPNELDVDLSIDSSTSRYLGLITTLNCINDKAVSRDEAKRARALILLLEKRSDTFLRNLRTFFQVPDPGLLYDLFPPGSLDALLNRLCSSFAAQVDDFRHRCDWAAAYRAVGEVSRIFGISQTLDTLINSSLRYVGAWARWRPVEHRVFGQEDLSPKHRNELHDVLVLNGPDFTRARQRSALDALLYQACHLAMDHICHGRFFVWLSTDARFDSRKLLDGICNFPSGSRLSMEGAVDVFIFLCLRNQVSLNTLRVLEQVAALREPLAYKSLTKIFYSPTSSVRTSGTMHLLQTIHASGNHALIDHLNGYVRDIIQEDLKDMQMSLYDAMENGAQRNPQPMALQVQILGQSIANIPSLWRTLDQDTQLLLQEWPSAPAIEALFDLRAELLVEKIGTTLEIDLDRYCLVRLTGRGILTDDSRAAIASLLWHWQERLDVPRRTLALSIVSCSYLSLHLRINCLLSIRDMEEDHLRKLDNILSSGTDTACTHLADLISSRRFLRHQEPGCWKDVLLSMVEARRETLLDNTLAQMDIKTWFQWLQHLRKIFDIDEGASTNDQPILNYQLHSWSQVLEAKYTTALSRLETVESATPLLQSALKDWQYQNPIAHVLDALLREEELGCQTTVLGAIGHLQSEGRRLDYRFWDTVAESTSMAS